MTRLPPEILLPADTADANLQTTCALLIQQRDAALHQLAETQQALAREAAGRAVDQKITKRLLETNEVRLELAMEAGQMGVWHWNIADDQREWLHGMAALHGLPMGTPAPGMPGYLQYVHPADRQHIQQTTAQTLAERKDHRLEYRIVWPDGQIRWMEGRGRLFLDASGTPTQMSGICVDITRRKQAEQNLQFLARASTVLTDLVEPQETLNRLAYLAVPSFADWCAIDLLQDDGSLKRVAVAHIDPAKVDLAKTLHSRFPPDPLAAQGVWQVLRSGQAEWISEITDAMLSASVQNPVYLQALRELGLKSYVGVPLTVHGKILGVVTFVGAESRRMFSADDLALAQDLAHRAAIALENARLYHRSREAEYGKDVFLATLAHELRNPLAPITHALGLLSLAPEDQGIQQRSYQIIDRQIKQLKRLVDDMMDITRITHGKIEVRKAPADLREIVEMAIETSRPLIDAAGHALIVQSPDQPMPLVADAVRLTQVFANLLNNAAKYTNAGGRIELRLQCFANGYQVSIKDSGIGIAAERQQDIFSLFAQVTHPLQRSQGGLGLGLSLVEGWVKLHGGTVSLMSDGIDCGSEFMVFLPLPLSSVTTTNVCNPVSSAPSFSMPTRSIAPSTPHSTHQSQRILVVDDNIDGAETVAEILKMLGHTVQIAHEGLCVLDTAKSQQSEVIFLDIGLPGMDGYEVARRLRADPLTQACFLVALTGWGDAKDRQQALTAGFDEHMVKPVDLARLTALLEARPAGDHTL